MKRTWMRQAAVAMALAVTLALAAPVQAASWETWASGPELVRAGWQWMARLWPAPEGAGQPERSGPAWEKAGSCVNPDGQPACEPKTNASVSADPKG
jgi:hypothetical protein